MSTPTADNILEALKATVDRNIKHHCSQGFGNSESYAYQLQ